ncbi:MAG: hypothetical protein ACK5FU_09535 [Bacteroidota bacterium]
MAVFLDNAIDMKTLKLILLLGILNIIACNSAKKTQEENRRQQKKMNQMEQEKDEFKRKNDKELK